MRIAFRGLGVGPRFITDASRVTVTCNAKGCEKPLIAKFVRKDKHIPLAICGGGATMWAAGGVIEWMWTFTRPKRVRSAYGSCQTSTRFPVKMGISTRLRIASHARPKQVGQRSAGHARTAAARRAWLRPA